VVVSIEFNAIIPITVNRTSVTYS